jgi:hypothetical protein
MKQWLYWAELDPKLATSPKLLPEIVKRFRVMAPVVEMLNRPLAQKRVVGAASRLPGYSLL